MNERIEGTIALDGLIEGKLPPEGELPEKLNEWVRFAGSVGLNFTLEIEGNSFSVLADPKPIDASKLAPDAGETVRECVDQLVQAFPAPQRPNLFSTLRSSEWRPGREVQAIYAIGPDGRVQITERTVDMQTVAPAAPLSLLQRVKLGMIGVAIAAVVIFASTFVIDYGPILDGLRNATEKVSPENTAIDHGPFEPYLRITDASTRVKNRQRYLDLVLERTDQYPTTPEALQALDTAAGDDLFRRLTVEALARGQLTVELYNDKPKLLSHHTVRISELSANEKITVTMPIGKDRPEEMRLRF